MNTRLTLRLTAPLMTLSVLLLGTAVAMAWYVQRLQADNSEILESNVASMRAAEELEIALREVRTHLDRFLLSEDPNDLAELPALRGETDRWLAETERVATTDYEQQLIVRIKRGYRHFFEELDRVAQPKNQTSSRREMRRLIDRVLTEEILGPVHEYLDFNEEEAARASARNRQTVGRMVFVLLLLGICGPLAGLLAGYAMTRRINRSIVRLTVPLQDATGKLNPVVGPITFPPDWGLEEMEGVLRRVAEQVGTVVERLQQSQREALRAEQLAAVGQMAAGFAHELRNPLMSMKILVQSAAGRADRAALHGRDLAVLEEEINRLEQLTSSLLDFARPPQPRPTTIDVRRLIDDVIDLVSRKAGQRDIRLDCTLPDQPIWIDVDTGQMRQVLLNLVLNALEAVQENGTVQLSAGVEREGESATVVLRVADTGPGLPPELGTSIFTPFVSTKPTGIGLGLSITKRIVETHGGSITAVNQTASGAAFTIRLPSPALVFV